MSVHAYTRANVLGALPELVSQSAGPEAVGQIFRDQQVPLALLDRPSTPLLHRDFIGLHARASRVAGERCLGLRSGDALGIGGLGDFGRYVGSAPDLERALVRARETLQFHESFSTISVRRDGDDIRFSYRHRDQNAVGWRNIADLTLCVLIDIVRCFLGQDWRPKIVELPYQRGPWEGYLEEHFEVPVVFGKPAVAIVFSQDRLGARSLMQPSLTDQVTHADVARQGRNLPLDFLGMCVEVIRQRLLSGQADLDGAASKLGLGPRTLQRRLVGEGISYKNLLAGCQRERAAELLAEDVLSLTGISTALGYSSQSQFSRAFKQWTGMTPGQLRKTMKNAA